MQISLCYNKKETKTHCFACNFFVSLLNVNYVDFVGKKVSLKPDSMLLDSGLSDLKLM